MGGQTSINQLRAEITEGDTTLNVKGRVPLNYLNPPRRNDGEDQYANPERSYERKTRIQADVRAVVLRVLLVTETKPLVQQSSVGENGRRFRERVAVGRPWHSPEPLRQDARIVQVDQPTAVALERVSLKRERLISPLVADPVTAPATSRP